MIPEGNALSELTSGALLDLFDRAVRSSIAAHHQLAPVEIKINEMRRGLVNGFPAVLHVNYSIGNVSRWRTLPLKLAVLDVTS